MNELVILNTVLIVVLLGFFIRQVLKEGKIKKQLKQNMEDCGRILEEYPSLLMADLQFTKKLKQMDQLILNLEQKILTMENKRENDGGYQHALKILEMGGSKQEIMQSCHLTSAEADLLINLHGYRTAIKE